MGNHDSSQYEIMLLNQQHIKDKFDSGIPALNQYLRHQAGQDKKRKISMPYVLTCTGAQEILGYYTLSSTSVIRNKLPLQNTKKLPHYPALPGVLIGRLAVDIRQQGKGIGVLLLMDALSRSFDVSQQIGVSFIIVEAKDDRAVQFYQKYDFKAFTENRHKLILPMKTVQQLLHL